ncbi:hypothetical protein DAPPUDRAFT_237038 [Daphnia pulex]|uniref:Uncharacterized protein n=1 Tax=Daphnia pulex TaxID=6669 RepID=E9G2L6_DAPPU|nr:hypothetical protein DAPPUDRAFT_237038 [Daphnia pulex]|eukprot:EFX86295.1 hypothetical protein DAPPUDRAFT_237038 [Daphnia pulex]
MVNYGAVLLLGVESLMVGSTMGVQMLTFATSTYYAEAPKVLRLKELRDKRDPSYITKAPEYYTTEYTVPAYYTEIPKYYTTTNAARTVKYYTEPSKYYSTLYTTTTEATKYYVAQTSSQQLLLRTALN